MSRAWETTFPRVTGAAEWVVRRSAALLAATFLLYGLIASGLMVVEVPPYQNPDEINHFLRAEQVSKGGWLSGRIAPGVAGGMSDIGIARTAIPFNSMPFHPDVKATAAMYAATAPIGWGEAIFVSSFQNTSLYPPTCYLPAAVAIRIGKAGHHSVVNTLYLARACTGICATLMASLAILIAGATATWLFAVLSLPMTLSLFTSVSQDGMLLALAALCASLLSKSLRERVEMATPPFIVLCLGLAAICMARPPYLPLALLLLLAPWKGRRHRIAAVAVIGLLAAGWSIAILRVVGVNVAPDPARIDPLRQIASLLHHAGTLREIARTTLTVNGDGYLEQVTGQLGWLDVQLPPWFEYLAWRILALAAACCVSGGRSWRRPRIAPAALILTAQLATVLAIFGIQYLLYSPVGSPIVDGVQGRYFLPPLLFGACLLGLADTTRRGWLAPPLGIVAAFPIVSIGVMTRAVVLRYYF